MQCNVGNPCNAMAQARSRRRRRRRRAKGRKAKAGKNPQRAAKPKNAAEKYHVSRARKEDTRHEEKEEQDTKQTNDVQGKTVETII